MSKLSPELGKFFSANIEDLRKQPGEKITINRAVATLRENQRSEVTVRGFTLVQDEPVSAMGTAKGPTPTDFFISSVALCENVIFARNASVNGLSVDSLETTATGEWNMKGLWEIEGADSAFRRITVETRVQSDAAPSGVANVARLTHKRCPIYATLRKSVELTFKLTVNGTDIPL
jgi:putative redox protein